MTLLRDATRRSAHPAKGYLRTRRPKASDAKRAESTLRRWMDAVWYNDRNDLRERFQERFLHELN